MGKNVEKILDKIEANLKLQYEKLKLMRENSSCIEYWEDHGKGEWKPLTEEKAMKRANGTWYLVKTDVGTRLVKTL